MQDNELLRSYANERSEEAFAELVRRHIGLVYSAALRQVGGNSQLAEDVTQAVFTDLARKAGHLTRHTSISGWLYTSTRFLAGKARRTESRRRAREQEAHAMNQLHSGADPDPAWEELQPLLDDAMHDLKEADREAVLLRFFESRSLSEMGSRLGLGENAARMRVDRAIDKLRLALVRRGVTSSAVALATMLSRQVIGSVPPTLAGSVTSTSLAVTAGNGNGGLTCIWQWLASNRMIAIAALVAILTCSLAINLRLRSPPGMITVDLTPVYNGGLDTCWLPNFEADNNLAALPHGRHRFHGVPFEVRGVVQLEGQEWKRRGYSFPERVEGIQIGATGFKLHLLHANSAFADPPGTAVASLILHYPGGQEAQIEIQQGRHILDWWTWKGGLPSETNSVVAWTGENEMVKRSKTSIRLFMTTFLNPHPGLRIETIDYVSAMAGSAPFMVAMTLEH